VTAHSRRIKAAHEGHVCAPGVLISLMRVSFHRYGGGFLSPTGALTPEKKRESYLLGDPSIAIAYNIIFQLDCIQRWNEETTVRHFKFVHCTWQQQTTKYGLAYINFLLKGLLLK